MSFVPVSELQSRYACEQLFRTATIAIRFGYIPTYEIGGEPFVHSADLGSIPLSWKRCEPVGELALKVETVSDVRVDCWTRVILPNRVELLLPPIRSVLNVSAVFAAARFLARFEVANNNCGELAEIVWPFGVIVYAPAHSEAQRSSLVIGDRMQRLLADRAAEFTKSAYYMGSKHALAPFLVEVVANFASNDGQIIDLMCGAGSASRAFSHEWDVIACDAMAFCADLAACLSRSDAIKIFTEGFSDFQAAYNSNMRSLAGLCDSLLVAEEQFLYSADSFEDGIAKRYADFCKATPRVPHEFGWDAWFPSGEVDVRRKEPGRFPFCLSLAYFGNLFFGIRQAIELDSVRFAIGQVRDAKTAIILRAALVSTASYIGTGYASQFAQPVAIDSMGKRQYTRLIEKRCLPVFSEFVARATAIGAHAQAASREIEPRIGSWRDCLLSLDDEKDGRHKYVYVDAPYTRDEYARYYHVLESLVRYSYPVTSGKSNVPVRSSPEMFQSEFFTRIESSIPKILIEIIRACVDRCRFCFWSYSSGARASICEVVERLLEFNIEVVGTFGAGHSYQPQGGRGRVKAHVIEYVLVFQGRKR